MSKNVLSLILFVLLFFVGAFISLIASALLFNDSWRQTMQALNSEGLLRQQLIFISGICTMFIAILFTVKCVLKKDNT